MVDDQHRPVVQIFANSEAALVRMRQTAEMAECRIASAQPIDAHTDPNALVVPGAAILIELDNETAVDVALPLLDWIGAEAERSARCAVLSVSPALVDLAAARAWQGGIALLCDASEEERLGALAGLARRPAAGVHDSRRERGFPILQPGAEARPVPPRPEQAHADAAWLRRAIRARRLRTHFFRADLFADPAWDMLLDLMAARLEGKQVAVSSLCIAAAVPPTTALRWLGLLTEHGLVVRVADRDDRRRVYVELGEATAQALGAWLWQTRALEVETA